jgi:hypothetical protein
MRLMYVRHEFHQYVLGYVRVVHFDCATNTFLICLFLFALFGACNLTKRWVTGGKMGYRWFWMSRTDRPYMRPLCNSNYFGSKFEDILDPIDNLFREML